MIGYPKIFHTDNGKEFTAKTILTFLCELHPGFLSVTGRSMLPCDQGSVEVMNKLVKRVFGSVLAERRLAGDNPNWTEVFGSVASTIITQHGCCMHNVGAYKSVFGQNYDHEMTFSKDQGRGLSFMDS